MLPQCNVVTKPYIKSDKIKYEVENLEKKHKLFLWEK